SDFDFVTRHAEVSAEQGGTYEPEDEAWPAAIAEEIKDLRGRIARLGNVNLDAIDELAALESRQQELAGQVGDLTDAKTQLEDLIDTINRESGEKFEQTFNLVRDEFQTNDGMFRKLFGGGRADIYLQTEVEERRKDEDGKFQVVKKSLDLLEAGIEIVARPPGKQPVSISQLSGGEKTMTCVALLMSIFKSKPSPFCILDEVDAALDEANNVRFNRIVEEFLGTSQFIIITHSKPTMQIADVLYGVTMQEQGVSKKVEVRFDQVGGDGRIKS
ncbi:MAG: AAA family ATPase, partial [Planctomycetota bacterium]